MLYTFLVWLIEKYNINIYFTYFSEQANGLVERHNQTIKKCILKVLQENVDCWPDILDGVLFAHRSVVQRSTGFSPFFMMYNRHPVLPIDTRNYELSTHPELPTRNVAYETECNSFDEMTREGTDPFDVSAFQTNLEAILKVRLAVHEAAQENIQKAQKRQKKQFDKRNSGNTIFKEGDLVLSKNLRRGDRKNGKWSQLPWSGPYKIIRMHDKGNCELQNYKTKVVLKKKINVVNLKKFV